eukprot:XP_012826175.1 PREDICTED: olfactory receptor 5B12-like [Xenopus tropicalis]
MENQTIVYVLVLSGLSDLPNLRLPLFCVFLLIYLMTLFGNLLVLVLIFSDSHLHTPMYFFLGTLACLDMSYSSATSPRMLFDLLTGRRIISVPACITQVFFFLFCAESELSVLAVMSYDRYIAICRFTTILKIPSKHTRAKAFSTCSSHLTVVFIFYTTSFFNYFRSNTNEQHAQDKIATVVYAILIPFLNPVIYSLRNQELKTSLRKALQRM